MFLAVVTQILGLELGSKWLHLMGWERGTYIWD